MTTTNSKKAKDVVTMQAESMTSRIKEMLEKEIPETIIIHQLAEELQTNVDAKDRGTFISLINNALKGNYQVKDLMEYDTSVKPEYQPGDATAILRATVNAGDKAIKDGSELSAEQMEALNSARNTVIKYDQNIAAGKTPAEAEAIALGDANAQAAIAAAQSMNERENSWFQPKYMAAGSALVGGGVAMFAGTRLSIGSAAGTVLAAGVSYFAADYVFSKVAMLSNLNPWLANALASALGMSLGVGGARAGVMLEDRFFPNAPDADDVQVPAINAPTAELSAYF